MATKFEILSVYEDDGESNRIAAGAGHMVGRNFFRTKITVTNYGDIVIHQRHEPNSRFSPPDVTIKLGKTDIDSIIQFLQEAKQFIKEQELVDTLMGIK